jgi:drug/metabolite transporter (DMT)-like permease
MPTTPTAPADPRGAVVRMLIGCLFFAFMALFVGLAHRADPQLHTVVASLFRALGNFLLLFVIARGRVRELIGDARPALLARGIWGSLSLLCYFGALERLDIGPTAFLNQTSAVWVAILAPLFLGEKTRKATWFAVLGSLLGIALLGDPRHADPWGIVLGLASGLLSSFAYLSVSQAGKTNGPIAIVGWFTLTASVLTGAWTLAFDLPIPHDPRVLTLLCGAGFAATLGQLAMTRAYQLGAAAPVAAAGAAGPLFTTLLGGLVLHQLPTALGVLGMVLLSLTAVALPLADARLQTRRSR